MFRKYQGVFQSRWKALLWAAGVCLTAYCTVPSPDEGNDGGVGKMASTFAHSGGGSHARHGDHAKDPWALDDSKKN